MRTREGMRGRCCLRERAGRCTRLSVTGYVKEIVMM